MNRILTYLFRLLLCLLPAWPTVADVTDFQVNDDGLSINHERPRIAVSTSGSFWIAWSDQRTGHSDIYIQRYSPTSQPLGGNQRINSDSATAWQINPALAATPGNWFMTVWQDYRYGAYPFGPDIFLQRLDSSADPLNANQNISLELPDSLKENPDIAVGPDGTAVVVWADFRNRNWDVYGQVIDTSGALIGSNFKVNDDLNLAQQHSPRISISPQGWFVVAWYDNRQGNDDIFVQRFDPARNKVGQNHRANSDITISRQAFPDVAADARGRFTVVWTDWRNGTYPANPDIYSRRFDTLYQPLSIDTRVNTDASVRAQRDPAIAADRIGNVAVVWSDSGATSWDISGQLLDADGTIQVASFRANTHADSAQLLPDVALDGRNRYVAWVDKRAGSFNIYASVAQYNDARLTAAPLSLQFSVNAGGPLPSAQQVIVEHFGLNPLGFKAISSDTWLGCSPSSATTPETVAVSIQQLMPQGTYQAELTLVDTFNNDSSLVVPVSMSASIPPSSDSVIIGAVSVRPNQFVDLPVQLYLGTAKQLATIPLVFNSTYLSVTSVALGASLTGRAAISTPVNAAGQLVLRLTANSGDSLPAGNYVAATIRMRATASQGLAIVDSATIDSFKVQVKAAAGSLYAPVFIPGEVMVSLATDVEDSQDLPAVPDLALAQNYPNPFNLTTRIDFALSTRSEVRLDVFNILGQHLATVHTGVLSAGEHSALWNGDTDSGSEVPSGIYFYRLQAVNRSIVRKLVVLK